jgi:hypothetical protein
VDASLLQWLRISLVAANLLKWKPISIQAKEVQQQSLSALADLGFPLLNFRLSKFKNVKNFNFILILYLRSHIYKISVL